MTASSIADLAYLSDSRTAALVDRDGVVLWYCPLRFDGPSMFGGLLDPAAGSWRVGPREGATSTRRYLEGSLVLRTEFRTRDGRFALTDFLALEAGTEGHDLGRQVPNALVRVVEWIEGRPTVGVDFRPRPEYGLVVPRLEAIDGGLRAQAGPLAFRLDSDIPLELDSDRAHAHARLGPGDRWAMVLTAWPAHEETAQPRQEGEALLQATHDAWRSWSGMHTSYDGRAANEVRRSAVVLQGLTDARTGAVVAAATTSLPEVIGGSANWDYRYAWLRDLSFVTRALWTAACPDEADAFLQFIARSIGRPAADRVPILLGTDGRHDLSEHELDHLAGYRGSRPVRVGNAAWRQRQLDVAGEVVDSAHLMRDQIGRFAPAVRELLVGLAEYAAAHWREDDAGMWEARDRERPYTSSKVMAWVALDRILSLADLLDEGLPLDRWRRERDAIHEHVIEGAWSSKLDAFAGAIGSDELDASVLLLPLVGFLEPSDPRLTKTVDGIREGLTSGALVHRWDGDANGFLLTSYWLVECEALQGDIVSAGRRFDALNALANDVGLLAEMAEPGAGAPIGNVPQAFSHVGLINAAWRLTEAGAGGEPP